MKLYTAIALDGYGRKITRNTDKSIDKAKWDAEEEGAAFLKVVSNNMVKRGRRGTAASRMTILYAFNPVDCSWSRISRDDQLKVISANMRRDGMTGRVKDGRWQVVTVEEAAEIDRETEAMMTARRRKYSRI